MLPTLLQDDVILGDGEQGDAGGNLAPFPVGASVESNGPPSRVGGEDVGAVGQRRHLLAERLRQGAERRGM